MSPIVSVPAANRASDSSERTSPDSPSREAIIAKGDAWVIGWSAPVLFTLFHRQPSEVDFALYIAAQAKDIDEWPTRFPRSVVHHATAVGSLNAAQRQAAADMLSLRRDKLATICFGYVFCTQSGITRGISKVISWLAPPAYPCHYAANVTEGLMLLRGLDPRIEPRVMLGRYKSLFGDFLPNGEVGDL